MHNRNTGSRLVPEGQVATGISNATASAAMMKSTESPQIHRPDPSGSTGRRHTVHAIRRPAPIAASETSETSPAAPAQSSQEGPFAQVSSSHEVAMNATPATMRQPAVTKPAILPAGDISARIGPSFHMRWAERGSAQGWFLPTTVRE